MARRAPDRPPSVMARALEKIRDGLLSLTYPEDCRVCGDAIESWDDGAACARCWQEAAVTRLFLSAPLCARCGAPLPAPAADPASCRQPHCATFAFAAARACGAYEGALRANALFLKSRPHLCRRLRRLLAEAFERHSEALAAEVIVPVPLAADRQRMRGFNQAAVIAGALARTSGLPVAAGALARVRATERHRAGMDALDRARSLRGAFAATRPRLVMRRSVLLVDDVLTTGSTADEAARALLDAGAARVSVLTLARVAGPGYGRVS